MMGSLDFATILAERVLNSIPEGLLIAGFAWLLLRLVDLQSGSRRYSQSSPCRLFRLFPSREFWRVPPMRG
jgi:hypothetical protein